MILLISVTFPPEPTVSASLTNDLALALSKKWKVKVLSPKPSRPQGYSFTKVTSEKREFEHIILNSFTYPKSNILGRMFESYSFGKHAAYYIKENQADIQCIYLNAWPLLAQYYIIKASKRYSLPSVIHIQDIYPESLFGKLPVFANFFIKLLIPFDKWIQENSSKVVVISDKMKHLLIRTRYLKEHKISVVHNWQNEEFFIASKSFNKEEHKNELFTFMFLGSLNITAAVNVIISAFNKCNIKNSRLVIAGNGAEKDNLISLARSCDGVNIEFWDAPITEVPAIQDKADVLILNLKRNAAKFSLPSKLPAYMFSEKPIIACVEEDSDTANAIKQADCGWIVSPENTDILSKAMKIAASFPEKDLHRLGRNGFNYALKNFSKNKNLQKLVDIIIETEVI
jgi:glycosyltransferase involved in cell wall biosynthesis